MKSGPSNSFASYMRRLRYSQKHIMTTIIISTAFSFIFLGNGAIGQAIGFLRKSPELAQSFWPGSLARAETGGWRFHHVPCQFFLRPDLVFIRSARLRAINLLLFSMLSSSQLLFR